MKHAALLIISIALVGCGKGFKAQGAVDQKSMAGGAAGPDGYVTPQESPVVGVTQANGLSVDLTKALVALFKSFANINGISFTQTNQTLSANQTVSCPLGGSISAAASGNLSLGGSVLSGTFTGAVVNGNGSVTFNNCVIDGGITVNGTAGVAAVKANLTASINAQLSGFYSVSAAHQIVGNISVSSGSIQQNCALALTDALSVTGTFSAATQTSAGTITANLSGTACNLSVNQTLSQVF